MPLNPTQVAQANQWFSEHNITLVCPICQNNGGANFTTGDIVAAPVYGSTSAPEWPMLQIICNRCAHVLTFAAHPMGLI
jgi:hypothetical protein